MMTMIVMIIPAINLLISWQLSDADIFGVLIMWPLWLLLLAIISLLLLLLWFIACSSRHNGHSRIPIEGKHKHLLVLVLVLILALALVLILVY